MESWAPIGNLMINLANVNMNNSVKLATAGN